MYDQSMNCEAGHCKPRMVVCTISAEGLSLPPPGTTPVPLMKISPTCAAFLSKFRDRMLRQDDDVDWIMHQKQRVYADPVFHQKDSLLKLAHRFHDAGMLSTCEEMKSSVCAFGVVKGYTEKQELRIRAVWDQRQGNYLWQEPPFIPLGSPAALCNVDLSELEEGKEVWSAVGDLPDWFYRLEIPADMHPWFVLKGITVSELKAHMKELSCKCHLPD